MPYLLHHNRNNMSNKLRSNLWREKNVKKTLLEAPKTILDQWNQQMSGFLYARDRNKNETKVVSRNTTQLDEYSMMPHRQGNAKLEYNGVFRAQLCMITGSRSVK